MLTDITREEIFSIISEIERNPSITQRLISKHLDISLGKTNYLLRFLIQKGLIKARFHSFHSGRPERSHYVLTRKGEDEKARLTYHFLKKKEDEYNQLKQGWDKLAVERAKKSAVSIQ